mgnify:CR=1 FL=1
MTNGPPPRRRNALWYLLFCLPVGAVLWVPFYNALEPRLAGVPGFYWYQFLWIIITAVWTAGGYRAKRGRRPRL